MSRRLWSFAASLALLAATLPSGQALAADAPIAVGEVAPPPVATGLDAPTLRSSAETELRRLDPTRLPRRRVVVSLAVTRATELPVACTVHATLRDERTGVMLAIIEGEARAEGSTTQELKKQVARAALRSAVRQIPVALGGK